jgi:dipeptidyl aminopeptidase/acylaminoacyl peptidase
MSTPLTIPYGSWKSPITADLIVASTIGLVGASLDGHEVYWQEQRPSEGGRNVVICHKADGTTLDLTPTPFNVRTRVHEYGGGAFTVQEGIVYFSNFADQRLYRQFPHQEPQPITPATELRYADGEIDPLRNAWIGVREDHRQPGEAINTIVRVSLTEHEIEREHEGEILVSGNDFYACPRLSPDGTQLAWIAWDHPNMPWDSTTLWVGTFQADGSLGNLQQVAGGPTESIFQPSWSPDGRLYFVSDRTNWWNLYRFDPTHPNAGPDHPDSICPMEAEFGLPQWVFGMTTYGFISAQEILCSYTQQGTWYLARLDIEAGKLQPLDIPYTEISGLKVLGNRAVFLGGSATEATALVELDLETEQWKILKRSTDFNLDRGYFSIPEAIAFPTANDLLAYGIYYPPNNKDYQAPAGERPPLLVKSHGGPTAMARQGLNLGIQYWTSRGFAVLDVNYGGSTGYGRAYRERLKGQWGIVDVEDCANGAQYLVARGDGDDDRLTIDGGSAGGYTTLCALAFKTVFKAGASHYGVSDLSALAEDTHKFESRYLDNLIGPYPEAKA